MSKKITTKDLDSSVTDVLDELVERPPVQDIWNRGQQIVNVTHDTPVDLLEFEGKTVINYLPGESFAYNETVNPQEKANAWVNGKLEVYSGSTSHGGRGIVLGLKVGTPYTMKFKTENASDGIQAMVSIGTTDAGYDIKLEAYPTGTHTITFTPTTSTVYIKFLRSGAPSLTSPAKFYDLSLNEGSTAKEFVTNVKGVTNPTIEVKGRNLVPSFYSRLWTIIASLKVDSEYKATLTVTDNIGQASTIDLSAKENTTYTLSAIHNGYIYAVFLDNSKVEISRTEMGQTSSLTFTTPTGTKYISVRFSNYLTPTGVFTFENLMLNEGTSALPFEPYRSDSLTVVDTFYEGDKVDVKKGTVTRKKKEIVLDGSLPWTTFNSYIGSKKLSTTNFPSSVYVPNSAKAVKYNGKILGDAPWTDMPVDTVYYDGNLLLSVANIDTGWGDNYAATADELKAYFMGWKMYDSSIGISSSSTYNRTDGLNKAWARYDKALGWQGVTTLPTTKSTTGLDGSGASYRLVLDLSSPQTESIKTIGSLILESGENTVSVTEGGIVRERMKPLASTDGVHYRANISGHSYYGNADGRFKFKNSVITKILKNGEEDNVWSFVNNETPYNYGVQSPYVHKSNFDPTAIYEVEYVPLETYKVSAYATPISIEYLTTTSGILGETVNDIAELESRVSSNESVMGELVKQVGTPVVSKGELVTISDINFATSPTASITVSGLADYRYIEVEAVGIGHTHTTTAYSEFMFNNFIHSDFNVSTKNGTSVSNTSTHASYRATIGASPQKSVTKIRVYNNAPFSTTGFFGSASDATVTAAPFFVDSVLKDMFGPVLSTLTLSVTIGLINTGKLTVRGIKR